MPDPERDATASRHSSKSHGTHHSSHHHAGHPINHRAGYHTGHSARHSAFAGATAEARDEPGRDDAEPDEADYYAVLGVARGATQDEVRHAYHRLAKLWHPDRFMNALPALRERAERRTRGLNAAYAVLGDQARRAVYDLGLSPVGAHQHHPEDYDGAHGMPLEPVVRDVYEHGRATVAPQNDGTGMFLGALVAIIALMLILTALKQQPADAGGVLVRYLTLGAGFILAGVAFWCATQENMLVRVANQVLTGAPLRKPDQVRGGPGHAHHPHHSDGAGPAHATHEEHERHEERAAPHASAGTAADADDEADAAFEQLVAEAVASIPEEFKSYLNNVVVRMKRNPSAEDIARLSIREHGLLLGLYEGVDVTRQGAAGAPLPEVITIYRRPIERYCRGDPDRIREQIRRTVLHELAHHFGIDHEAMPDWIR